MQKDLLKIKGVNPPKTKLGLSKMKALLDASRELFTKVGFFETSVSDICKHANTAVGTFYIYFESKTDVYRLLLEEYKKEIKAQLAKSIANCSTRKQKEREGIKCFIKYAVSKPEVYNFIWGSLAIDQQMFVDYYESFAKSYATSLSNDGRQCNLSDTTTIAYMLMGITNFLGLRAIFENMQDQQIDKIMDETVMPFLSTGLLKE